MNLFFELHKDLPREGPGDPESTEKAFRLIPNLPLNPCILDIGCGPGTQTIQLAQLSSGLVTAIDTQQPFLDQLNARAKQAGCSEQIRTINMSMTDLQFEPESFDLIWSEGAIYIAGFQNGLTLWRPFLKPGGFIAVTEISWIKENPPETVKTYWENEYPGMKSTTENITIINQAGYELIGHFSLPERSWWENYYQPLQKRADLLKQQYAGNEEMLAILASNQEEMDIFKRYFGWYSYVFYIMQKKA